MKDNHYSFEHYVSKARWSSYRIQIQQLLSLGVSRILLVGKGDGIVAAALQQCGLQVKTVDIDPTLQPDYLCSIDQLEQHICDAQFDCVVCCQVLEHLPFDRLEFCLTQLQHSTQRYCVVSLPQKVFRIGFGFFIQTRRIGWDFVVRRQGVKLPYNSTIGHYWEIGSQGASLPKVEQTIGTYFGILHRFNNPDFTYHRFYVLEKKEN